MRYVLSGVLQRLFKGEFPWSTLIINALACFLGGLLWSLAERRIIISSELRIVIMIGFLGALSTFSTYSFETVQLIRSNQWLYASGNIGAQNVLCIVFLFAGLRLGQII